MTLKKMAVRDQIQQVKQTQNVIRERFQRGGPLFEEAERSVDEHRRLDAQIEELRERQFEAMAERITDDADAYELVSSSDIARRLRQFAVHIAWQCFPAHTEAEIKDLVDSLEDIDTPFTS
ncbi:hypothetical protein KDA_74630 [Dictyobacter alpinus]|uniref:Uncharacterized protein n=1 Tax=Dictyobacter alpinus TaxID=2014873 RepID=A0A402BKX7_9CHLR|nr:hypothetical protein KDA_74630 [Dictyobacter alpinus]